MNEHKTIYGKRQFGGHKADTIIPMGPVTTHRGPGERVLTISTYKGNRGLLTFASVCIEVDHASIHEICGGYAKQVEEMPTRATEKAVKVQHERVLANQLHTIYAEAVAFYQEKDAKKTPRPAPMPEPGQFDAARAARDKFEKEMDVVHGPDWTYHDLNPEQLATVDRLDDATITNGEAIHA